jgi:hypothetical protein
MRKVAVDGTVLLLLQITEVMHVLTPRPPFAHSRGRTSEHLNHGADRPSHGAMIRSNDRILVVRERGKAWSFLLRGHVETGEPVQTALLRELDGM